MPFRIISVVPRVHEDFFRNTVCEILKINNKGTHFYKDACELVHKFLIVRQLMVCLELVIWITWIAIFKREYGFYPDFTDTSKKADNGPRRCVISKRRKYSAEFKREAVALANDPSVTQSQIAQELGISANMLGRGVGR